MSLLPTTKYIKILSASDPSHGWAINSEGYLRLEPVADVETFNFASPCTVGGEEQSIAFRTRTNPDLQIRSYLNEEGQYFMVLTDQSVNPETFAADSCYKVEPAHCGVEGNVQFASIEKAGMYICSQDDGLIQLRAGDPKNDPQFANISCWTLVEGESIEEFMESDAAEEEYSIFETNRTKFEGDDQVIDETFENLSAEVTMASNDESNTQSSVRDIEEQERSGNLVVGASGGGYGAGAGSMSGSANDILTDEMRQLILNSEGADLRDGSSGEFDFLVNDEDVNTDPTVEEPKAILSTETAPQGLSPATQLIIAVILVVFMTGLVYLLRKHNIFTKIMSYFKR